MMSLSDEDGLIIEDGFVNRNTAWYQIKYWPLRRKIIALFVVGLIIAVAIIGPIAALTGNRYHDKLLPGAALLAQHGAVAADNSVCSEVGRNILVAGGHAVDAAVATALCQGVLNPFASGIGGGGVMMIYSNCGNCSKEELDIEIIDMRETAPAAATYDMYYADPQKSATGALAGGVPGELKGLYTAWQKYGKLPWADLVIPAANLAKNFTVQPLLESQLSEASKFILADPELAAVYAPHGVLLKAGQACFNPKLANTLNIIAENGVDIFYNGTLGQSFVQDILDAGGIITMNDLNNYSVVFRNPVSTFYMGYKMVLPPSPYGGLVMGLALNILERYNLESLGVSQAAVHWLVEALKFGFSDRLAMGDPDFVPQTYVQQQMMSKDHAAVLRQKLNASQTYPPAHYIDLTDEIYNITDHGTTHISIVDANRNAVSFTTTVNLQFGARFVSKSTGILLNDEMNDFSISNSTLNDWNLPPSTSNIIVPGKRPLSSMSPSMVFKDNKLFMLAGANGGPFIITSTLQTLLNVLSFKKDLYEAVEAPRLYVQFTPPVVQYEAKYPKDLIDSLKAKGNEVAVRNYPTAVQAIMVQEDNSLLAVSDSRKQGKPAGY